jgi:hypothetical protein
MFASTEELWLFTDWMLLDVAERVASGKNPTIPIRAVWIEYDDPNPKGRGKAGIRKGPGYMRGSDLPMRRYVVIRVMLDHGLSLKEACVAVAVRLNRTTEAELSSIASGFQKYRHPSREWLVSASLQRFEDWLQWEIRSNLLDSAIPIDTMSELMRIHAGNLLHDEKRSKLFAEKWCSLARRAIAVLRSRPVPQTDV